jgi:hypothetical protein
MSVLRADDSPVALRVAILRDAASHFDSLLRGGSAAARFSSGRTSFDLDDTNPDRDFLTSVSGGFFATSSVSWDWTMSLRGGLGFAAAIAECGSCSILRGASGGFSAGTISRFAMSCDDRVGGIVIGGLTGGADTGTTGLVQSYT